MSVTSSGRSSISSTISVTSGWLAVIELAMLCSSIVLPVRGGATIRPRWPLPIGVSRSITRPEKLSRAVSSLQPLVGIERRQVVEEDLVARFLGRLEVDGVDFDQREVALAFFRRADLAGDGVAGAQIEAADLRRRDVDVVRAGQIVVLGRAQEAESVGQAFQHAFREDEAALFRLRLQDLEDQLLLAQAGGAGDVHVLGDLVELLDAHILELDQVERRGAVLAPWAAPDLRRCAGPERRRGLGGHIGGRARRRFGRFGGRRVSLPRRASDHSRRGFGSAAGFGSAGALARRPAWVLRAEPREALQRHSRDAFLGCALARGVRLLVRYRGLFGIARFRMRRLRGRVFFRRVFRSFPAAGWFLPWVQCFRYRLPNFPHSPAC